MRFLNTRASAARIGLVIGIPLSMLLGSYGVARAFNAVSGWTTGETLTAADLNTLVSRIQALEGQQLCPDSSFTGTLEHDSLYNRDYTVCTRTIGGANDTMVKVGDFWIDRYEMSECPMGYADQAAADAALGTPTGYLTTAHGCSTRSPDTAVPFDQGTKPLTGITWFQAAVMCGNAGKRLCTNAEWQLAAIGTSDPGTSSDGLYNHACNIGTGNAANGIRSTGLGQDCHSQYGVEDMVGNVWEWVADWYQAGGPFNDFQLVNTTSGFGLPSDNKVRHPWPATKDTGGPGTFGADATIGLNGRAYAKFWNITSWMQDVTNGRPAAVIRGGSYANQGDAGTFALHAAISPANYDQWTGARCCAVR